MRILFFTIKFFALKLHNGSINCIVMAYAETAYEQIRHTCRHKKKTERIADDEQLFDCEIIQFLPFYNIVSIEDGMHIFVVIYSTVATPIYTAYEKVSYQFQTRYGNVIFDNKIS